eukprot:5711734-Karenia_brevis.AAC.1
MVAWIARTGCALFAKNKTVRHALTATTAIKFEQPLNTRLEEKSKLQQLVNHKHQHQLAEPEFIGQNLRSRNCGRRCKHMVAAAGTSEGRPWGSHEISEGRPWDGGP